jgi:4-amino-4-deoxychorismate lyase
MSLEGALRDGAGPGFDLIETMRWEPASGFLRFERHLARLYASASQFGFPHDPERIGEALKKAVVQPEIALRVRLVLSVNGGVLATAQPYEPVPPHKIWTLRVAQTRLSSADPLVRHKTSRRAPYVSARAQYQIHQADEVVLLNERGEVCEGTITNVFVESDDGVLLTPAVSCGLLPGVLRAELLGEGRTREAVLTPDDLTDGRRIFIGNSLRGLIPARLGG